MVECTSRYLFSPWVLLGVAPAPLPAPATAARVAVTGVIVYLCVRLLAPLAGTLPLARRKHPARTGLRRAVPLSALVTLVATAMAAPAAHAQPAADEPDDRTLLPPPSDGVGAAPGVPVAEVPDAEVPEPDPSEEEVPGDIAESEDPGAEAGAEPPPAPEPAREPVPDEAAPDVPADTQAAGITVTVAPGDCLWTIAATRLGPGASDAEIDRYWRVVYSNNREVIGGDPHLIHPGQQLVLVDP